MAESLVCFKDVTHSFGRGTAKEWKALQGISLEIRRGEFVAVVGHNGSGKSTLAKHMNGLLVPHSGQVIVNGMDTRNENQVWEIRRSVGMVFQNPDNQLVATTVEEDVAFGPENLGIPSAQIHERVEEALEAVAMGDYRRHPPHQLSGGQKQRVAIAGMIAMRPSCIVLDEPTAMLDPVGRQDVLKTIRQLNRSEGITIVHITHFMDEVIEADRVLVMENGRIELEGTPRQVFTDVNQLRKLHLEVPQITELASRLHQTCAAIPRDTLTIDELVESICRLC